MAATVFLTEPEHELIRSSVLLPMLLSTVEKNYQTLVDDTSKMSLKKAIYLKTTNLLIGSIKLEIARVKQELYRQKIKVVAPNFSEILSYAYVCRGFNQLVEMTREEVKRDINNRLDMFSSRLMQELGWRS